MTGWTRFAASAAVALAMLVLAWTAGAGRAETLNDALAAAYATNPTLKAAQAGQRATDEQVPQALSGWRPTVTVNGEIGPEWNDNVQTGQRTVRSDTGAVSIVLSQPVFRGFRTTQAVKAAEANVEAGRQNLLAIEQDVLFDAVQAFMNVYAGRQLVALQQENVRVLRGQLNASNERFKVGEITRTDVEQARASLAEAQAALANEKATLESDVARYIEVIGKEPGKLRYPKIARLPMSLKSALDMAGEINPSILAAALVEEASVYNIGVERSGLLPQISLQAEGSVFDDLSRNGDSAERASVSAVLSMPLYEAGEFYSRVREAKQLASQRRIEVIEVARAVRQAVTSAWSLLAASRQVIAAARTQVSAARLALEGVQQEYQAGTRTTLDVLDAQAVVVLARTTQVDAERSQIVAAYQLLGTIGKLTARDLDLEVELYDPAENYDAVRDKFIGTGVETLE